MVWCSGKEFLVLPTLPGFESRTQQKKIFVRAVYARSTSFSSRAAHAVHGRGSRAYRCVSSVSGAYRCVPRTGDRIGQSN